MKKIPTIFKRNPEVMRWVTDEVNPECQWVLDGEGVITRKYDGTCVMLSPTGPWWARRVVKKGKTAPENFLRVEIDEVTGHTVGWEPIKQSAFYKFFLEAAEGEGKVWDSGTYELCGPKINGNPEDYDLHELVAHNKAQTFESLSGRQRKPEDLKALVLSKAKQGWEGIVVHHPDGRMAKLKARDLH